MKTVPAPVRTPPAPKIPEPLLSGFGMFNMLFVIACVVFAIGVAARWW